MLIYSGKAKDYNFRVLLYLYFFKHARPLEPLEPGDFNRN